MPISSPTPPIGSTPRYPNTVARGAGVHFDHVFDSDANVDCNITISLVQRFTSNDNERLGLLLVVLASFLSSYFLPLRWKQPATVFWTMVGVGVLYGTSALAGLFCAHLLTFMILHPVRRNTLAFAVMAATSGLVAWEPASALSRHTILLWLCLSVGLWVVYQGPVRWLMNRPAAARILRTMAVQSAMIVVCSLAVVQGLHGNEINLALGVLLFFWQWERLILYHIDYKDGQVPKDVSLGKYLPVFFSPGILPNWTWGVATGQGYRYVHNSFLCEDKNRLVRSGLQLWAIALLYLVFGDWCRFAACNFFEYLGVPVYSARVTRLVEHFMAGEEIATVSVLATTMLDMFRWLFLWGGVVHFKVGIWRVCGYRVDAYFDKPWMATNLVSFWSRYTFHYREFLVRAFYYPVFFGCARWNRNVRIFAATLAAACIGNLTWGHVSERLFYRGLRWENVEYVLSTWPYFFMLAVGISICQIYLLKNKNRRKPWTGGWRNVLDAGAVYLTLQYYSLIVIYARPRDGSSVWDLSRLILRGLGIHW